MMLGHMLAQRGPREGLRKGPKNTTDHIELPWARFLGVGARIVRLGVPCCAGLCA